jgi:hypothetical protein
VRRGANSSLNHTVSSYSQAFSSSTSNVSFSYGYDAAGRITTKSSSNPSYNYNPTKAATDLWAADTLNRYPTMDGLNFAYYPSAGQ